LLALYAGITTATLSPSIIRLVPQLGFGVLGSGA